MASNTANTSSRRRGFTLIEAMIASVVLAASVIGLAGVLAASYQQSAIRGNTATALALAQQLMEEIASKPLELPVYLTNKPGWSAGQVDRRLYDTIDDYHGYVDVSGSIQTQAGAIVDLGDGGAYTRMVSVATGALPSGLTGPAADFVKVTVTIQMPRSQALSVSQFFTRATLYR